MHYNKTNAARLLDKFGIKYELVSYEVDESDLSAISVAAKLRRNIDEVYKTLVVRGDKSGVIIAVIPGAAELDLKKLAKVSGNKSVEMTLVKELFALTGYVRGGCSPIGVKKKYPVYIDESIILHDTVFVSAGQRGLQLKIKPDDLVKSANGKICNLAM
jgi:Cys-tRNA(Pro)/Cys-tRNA(Cys) deacylase